MSDNILSNEIDLVIQMVKNLRAMQETWIRSLGWEDSSGEGNGSPLQTEEPHKLQSLGSQSRTQLK